MIQAAIFDMDGLMLDTEPAYRIAWQAASAECGYDLPDPLYFTLIGRGRSEGEQTLVDAFGPRFPVDEPSAQPVSGGKRRCSKLRPRRRSPAWIGCWISSTREASQRRLQLQRNGGQP